MARDRDRSISGSTGHDPMLRRRSSREGSLMDTSRTLSTIALLASLGFLGSLLWFGAPAMAEPQAGAIQVAANKAATSKAKKAPHAAAPARAVMRGPDNIALVGRLPWWRSDRMQTVRYLDKTVASQVLTTADAWLGIEPDGIREAMEDAGRDAYGLAPSPQRERQAVAGAMVDGAMVDGSTVQRPVVATDESVGIGSGIFANNDASPQEPSEFSLAAAEPATPPADYSSLKGWLALLGGAIAAASTARFLFV
jgi:hypothetical protein